MREYYNEDYYRVNIRVFAKYLNFYYYEQILKFIEERERINDEKIDRTSDYEYDRSQIFWKEALRCVSRDYDKIREIYSAIQEIKPLFGRRGKADRVEIQRLINKIDELKKSINGFLTRAWIHDVVAARNLVLGEVDPHYEKIYREVEQIIGPFKIVLDSDCFHIYFGGQSRPDGLGHGHIRLSYDGRNIEFVRPPKLYGQILVAPSLS